MTTPASTRDAPYATSTCTQAGQPSTRRATAETADAGRRAGGPGGSSGAVGGGAGGSSTGGSSTEGAAGRVPGAASTTGPPSTRRSPALPGPPMVAPEAAPGLPHGAPARAG